MPATTPAVATQLLLVHIMRKGCDNLGQITPLGQELVGLGAPQIDDGKAKAYQVRQVLKAIDKLNEEQT